MNSDAINLKREAVDALETLRRCVVTEIRDYPTPISGCDAQFNHLLAERRRVDNALRDLQAAVFVPTPRTPSHDAGVESR